MLLLRDGIVFSGASERFIRLVMARARDMMYD